MAAAEPRTAGRSSPPTECGQPKSPSGQMEESKREIRNLSKKFYFKL